MLRYILTVWRPVALTALLALAATPTNVWAAGHGGGGGGHGGGGGFHGGGGSSFHGGGSSFHGGGYGGAAHYGGYNAGGYRPGYFSGYRNSYGNGYRSYGYGGYYSPLLYGSSAYLSGGDALPSDFYYSPNYTTTAPYSSVSAYYDPDGTAPTPAVTAPTVAPDAASGTATVDVHVPATAQVWFDDNATKQTGADRQYVSPPLAAGRNFTYDVRARWIDNGRVTDLTRTITVHANSVNSVDFTQPASAVSALR